jgi:hypothetical protein
MKTRERESGQALIVIVFAILGLFGITALAVDGGNTYLETRRAQNAADSAALGAALARIRGADWVDVAYAVAAENGFDNDGVSNSVVINSPPVSGPNEGNIEYIQVIISVNIPTTFARVVGIQETNTRVQAVARTKTPEIKEILEGNAVISLAPTSDCNNHKSFWIHGEATLDISNAGVFINSNNQDCALLQQGNGSIRIDGGNVTVVGGIDIQKPQLFTPSEIITGAIPISYPPPFMMPKYNCSIEAVVSEDGSSMSPGAWGEDFPPQGVHSLESGIYCIEGDFIVNSGYVLSGNHVMFKMEEGMVRWNSGAEINLGAPVTGEFAGLLIYMPIDNNSRIALNVNENSSVRGTILAPAADIRINGNDSENGFHSQIIGYRVEADGDSNVVIIYNDDQNYDALTMPEIQLTQ